MAGIKITEINKQFNIFALYRPPDKSLSQTEWNVLFGNKFLNEGRTLFLGDFNAHHCAWNCEITNSNGSDMFNSLEKYQLLVLNFNTTTHIDVSRNKKSNLDLVITDNQMAGLVNLSVNDEPYGSDHFPINLEISTTRYIYHKKSFRIRSTRTEWLTVKQQLENKYSRFFDNEFVVASASDKYNLFMKIFSETIKQNTPIKRYLPNNRHDNPVFWWNEESYKFKRLRRAAYKRYEFTHSANDYELYKKADANFKRLIRKKKRAGWRKFAETVDFKSDFGYVWKKMSIFKNKWCKNTNGSTTNNSSRTDWAHTAIDKISPPFVTKEPISFGDTSNDNQFSDKAFQFAEFNAALESRSTNSSSGPDGIDYYSLLQLPVKYKLILLDIYNEMYGTGDFPDSWKEAYVHLIDKPDGSCLRPIAMSNCACKIFELLVKNRLQWWCEVNDILPREQSGFRKGRSCIDNLANFTLFIEDGFLDGTDTLAAFLDIQGAYDNVVIDILLKKLSKIGCSTKLLRFVNHVCVEKHILSKINTDSPRSIFKGVPQSGVLSPILFNIYIAELTHGINKAVRVFQFADDIVLYCRISEMNRSSKLLGKTVSFINNKLLDIGLDLNVKKTKLMHFNKFNLNPSTASIVVDSVVINAADQARFLGIQLDQQLSFNHHVKKVQLRGQKILNITRFLCGTWWGAQPETLLIIYKSFLRSVIDYGCFVYAPKKKKIMETLEKIQFSAIRTALGFRRSTPKNIILEEAKVMSIKDRSMYLDCNFVTKALANKSHLCHKTLNKYFSKHRKSKRKRILERCIEKVQEIARNELKITEKDPLYYMELDDFFELPPVNLEIGFTLKQSAVPGQLLQKHIEQNKALPIYTDGSLIQGAHADGYAVWIPHENHKIRGSLSTFASIFSAEAKAIISALDWIICNPEFTYHILTDSRSVLQAMVNFRTNEIINPYIFEIKKKVAFILKRSTHMRPLIFTWIPAHVGIDGNEAVDGLAKEATALSYENKSTPFSDFKRRWKELSTKDTRNLNAAEGQVKGIIYFQRLVTDSSKAWFSKVRMSMRQIVTLNRLRANHYSSAASLARKNILESSVCECGNPVQNADQLLWECPLHEENRSELNEKLLVLGHSPPYNIVSFLSDMDFKVLRPILKFLDTSGLYL